MAKDRLLNELKDGDCVHFQADQFTWIIGHVEKVIPGGTLVPDGRKNVGMTPGRVVIVSRYEIPYDPTNPVCISIFKVNEAEKKGSMQLLT